MHYLFVPIETHKASEHAWHMHKSKTFYTVYITGGETECQHLIS